MKSIKYLSSLLILLATLTGCSGYQLVNSRTYDDGWLSKYSTFRIINTDEGKIPPGVDMTVYYNIANSIRQEMAYRGFHEDPSSPLLVNFGITVSKNINTEPVLPPNYFPSPGPYPGPVPGYYPFFMYPRQYYWPYYSNTLVVTGINREGVLTVDFVDTPQKKLLYTASVSTSIGKNKGFSNQKQIDEAVSVLFSKLGR
nr:DUF4136 domain-containing protein [uncultured bacterium]